MSKKRWDECCPHCEQKIEIYGLWVNSADYATSWEVDCPHCLRRIEVEVVSVPEFGLAKPESKSTT